MIRASKLRNSMNVIVLFDTFFSNKKNSLKIERINVSILLEKTKCLLTKREWVKICLKHRFNVIRI